MAKERRLDVSKPGPLASRPVNVRRNRAAPMRRIREKATWRVTIALRRRTPPKPVPPRPRGELIRPWPPGRGGGGGVRGAGGGGAPPARAARPPARGGRFYQAVAAGAEGRSKATQEAGGY